MTTETAKNEHENELLTPAQLAARIPREGRPRKNKRGVVRKRKHLAAASIIRWWRIGTTPARGEPRIKLRGCLVGSAVFFRWTDFIDFSRRVSDARQRAAEPLDAPEGTA
jgi:hypothetical protein